MNTNRGLRFAGILVLFVLVLIPALFPPKPLQLAPETPEPPPTPAESELDEIQLAAVVRAHQDL